MKLKLPLAFYIIFLISFSIIMLASFGVLAYAKEGSESDSGSGSKDRITNRISDDGRNTDSNSNDQNSDSGTKDRQGVSLNFENRKAIRESAKEDRLVGIRLKVCEERQDTIKNKSSSLEKFTSNMFEKFDAILSRVKEFYTNKVLPTGKSVSNYDSLLADIQTKRDAVQAALTEAKIDISGFSCDSANPKSQITLYREDMQAVKSALKDYRTSIKNLIVAVRGVVGSGESEDNKASEGTESKGEND